MEPLFSIIVPTFNLEPYITDCLESIESQTISKESFELIIIDDCSSDATCSKITDFFKNSTITSQFHQLPDNQGPGAARNVGINNAKGIFLLFVDGDDCLSENCLEEIEKVINECPNDVDAIAYNWAYLDNGEPGPNPTLNTQPRDRQRKDLNLALLPTLDRVKSYLGMNMDGSVIYTAVRKNVFLSNHIVFLPGLHEDIDVIFKVYWNCKVIKGVEKALYFKRDRIGSIVRTLSEKHITGYYRAWNEIGNFTKEQVSVTQWDAYRNYFFSGLTGSIAIVILKIFYSFSDDKNTRERMYEFAYECYLQLYHGFVKGRELPLKTNYDRIAGKFLAVNKTNQSLIGKRELLDAYIESQK
jgi:poly(ribitol-phosphate) beta-N-acetylglucosaminyltransferase